MNKSMSPIIQASELLNLYQTKKFVLVDVSNEKASKENYKEKHLAGALYLELNTQLADIKEDLSNGGRHPLPNVKLFAETLSNLGISAKSHVVIYDNKSGSNAAARFWWMLKSIGHKKVQVLNGGFQAAEKIGFPTTSKIDAPIKTEPYKIDTWKLPLANINEVEKESKNENFLIIDVRDSERYNGEKETMDLIAGNIQGAINVPFTTNLDENGLFLLPNVLKTKYQNIFGNKVPENIIVHCGSGVTACHTLLAIAYAGLKITKL